MGFLRFIMILMHAAHIASLDYVRHFPRIYIYIMKVFLMVSFNLISVRLDVFYFEHINL